MPVERNDEVSAALAAAGETGSRIDSAMLGVFLDELFRWNTQLALVSKRDTPAVVGRLLRQSVLLWDFTSNSLNNERIAGVGRVVDIGSGGGFPGLVWKMLSPTREFLLIERKERKVAFLERVIARAGLSGVTVVAADVRDAVRREDLRHANDLAVMMAVADPAEMAVFIERLLREPGYFCTSRLRDEGRPEERLGRRLRLLAQSDTGDGRFLVYENHASD